MASLADILPLHELLRLKSLPQYTVEPIVYYVTRFGFTLSPPRMYKYRVEAYILCSRGSCVGLHFIKDDVYFNGDVERLPDIIDGLLESGELSLHEIRALAKFFMVGVETIEEVLYENRMRSLVRGKRVAVVRGTAYLLDGDRVVPLGELSEEEVVRYGGRPVPDPVYTISSFIRRAVAPSFYLRGRGEILFCNDARRRCVCLQVEGIVDLLARRLGIVEKRPDRWIRRGNVYIVWVEGRRFESECPPRRVGGTRGGEKTEAHALEYIAI